MLDDLQRLVQTFFRDIQLAKTIETANEEDDLFIKAAITGFSYHSPIDEWARSHFDIAKSRIDREYPAEELAHYGVNSENIKLFYALSLGFLLGVYQSGEMTDVAFKTAEHQIPGLIMLHLASLTQNTV